MIAPAAFIVLFFPVSYKSLILVASIPATMPVDSLKKLSIRTENMNGEYEPSTVKVTISKLKEEIQTSD